MFWNRDRSSSEWTRLNKILRNGQWGFETDTGKAKLGDGITRWNDLDYFSGVLGMVPDSWMYLSTDGGPTQDGENTQDLVFGPISGSGELVGEDLSLDVTGKIITFETDGLYVITIEVDWSQTADADGGVKITKVHNFTAGNPLLDWIDAQVWVRAYPTTSSLISDNSNHPLVTTSWAPSRFKAGDSVGPFRIVWFGDPVDNGITVHDVNLSVVRLA